MMRLWIAIAIMLMLVAGVVAQVTVKGDARVWQEVGAAYDKLAKLKTYRTKMTVEGQSVSMVTEYLNPDRSRTVMKTEGVTMETVKVGNEVRYRMTAPGAPATWQCTAPPQGTQPPTDPKSAKGEVTISRLGDVTIEGTKTSGYEYAWSVQGQMTKQRLYVASSDGLPRRLVVMDAAGKPQTTFEYYDFNAPITIELAKCG